MGKSLRAKLGLPEPEPIEYEEITLRLPKAQVSHLKGVALVFDQTVSHLVSASLLLEGFRVR